jgi:hypothetical protein
MSTPTTPQNLGIEPILTGVPTSGHGERPYTDDQSLPKWLIPADRKGFQRLVQNFTPAWVRVLLARSFNKPRTNFALSLRSPWVLVSLRSCCMRSRSYTLATKDR